MGGIVQTCAVCGMTGYWVGYDPKVDEDRCINHIGELPSEEEVKREQDI